MSLNHSKQIAAALACLLATVAAHPALAQSAGALELGVFGGYSLLSNTSELGNAADPNQVPDNAALAGLRFGYHLTDWLGLEAEAKYALSRFRGAGTASPVLGWRGLAVGTLPLNSPWQPFAVFGFGGETLLADPDPDLDPDDTDSATVWGAGVRYAAADTWGARLDGRMLHVRERGDNLTWNAEFHLGLYILLGGAPADTDGDGVADATDKCPTVAGKGADGCPLPVDSDGDGVVDDRDKCPQQAGKSADGCPPDSDGDGVADDSDKCPQQAGNGPDGCPLDSDSDGVIDDQDKCPNLAGKGADGCPPDADGDGVADADDKCPKQAAKTADGCPLDSDHDGVPDDMDKSPNEPETKNGYQDDDGCPDTVPEKLKKFAGTVKGISFETDSAKIKASSFKLLDSAVKVLTEFKDTRVQVSGHTDNIGAEDHNQELSLARANSVRDYLISKGIDAARISTVGYGSERPAASNDTKQGRATNRRIEFKLD